MPVCLAQRRRVMEQLKAEPAQQPVVQTPRQDHEWQREEERQHPRCTLIGEQLRQLPPPAACRCCLPATCWSAGVQAPRATASVALLVTNLQAASGLCGMVRASAMESETQTERFFSAETDRRSVISPESGWSFFGRKRSWAGEHVHLRRPCATETMMEQPQQGWNDSMIQTVSASRCAVARVWAVDQSPCFCFWHSCFRSSFSFQLAGCTSAVAGEQSGCGRAAGLSRCHSHDARILQIVSAEARNPAQEYRGAHAKKNTRKNEPSSTAFTAMRHASAQQCSERPRVLPTAHLTPRAYGNP